MSHRSEYFEIIDKHLNNELTEQEINELNLRMEFTPELSEELNLQSGLQQAIGEQDIVSLRQKLQKITTHQALSQDTEKSSAPDSFTFGLAEELTGNQDFNGSVDLESINDSTPSFPRIHLYQHLTAAKENIYHFYKEQQQEHSSRKEQDCFSDMDEAIFEDVKNAMEENDLMDLRANLKQVAATVSLHANASNDIHDYLDQAMDPEQRARFEEMMAMDKTLAGEVQLFREIDLAAAEHDVVNLRNSLREIQDSALKFNSGIREIDGYIYNELSEAETALFEAELATSKDLYAEIDLIKNIDSAVQEKDIMQLRGNLERIAAENTRVRQVERSMVRLNPRRIAISVVAASLIALIGLAGLFRYTRENSIYQKFYARYETTGVSRSANTAPDQTFALALQKYNNQDYQSALNLLQEVASKDQANMAGHFYSALSLQELGRYKNAIEQYQVVVVDRDNLFIEQAQWYIGLCYLQTNEKQKAISQFKEIAASKGFYSQKAREVLDKIKHDS